MDFLGAIRQVYRSSLEGVGFNWSHFPFIATNGENPSGTQAYLEAGTGPAETPPLQIPSRSWKEIFTGMTSQTITNSQTP